MASIFLLTRMERRWLLGSSNLRPTSSSDVVSSTRSASGALIDLAEQPPVFTSAQLVRARRSARLSLFEADQRHRDLDAVHLFAQLSRK